MFSNNVNFSDYNVGDAYKECGRQGMIIVGEAGGKKFGRSPVGNDLQQQFGQPQDVVAYKSCHSIGDFYFAQDRNWAGINNVQPYNPLKESFLGSFGYSGNDGCLSIYTDIRILGKGAARQSTKLPGITMDGKIHSVEISIDTKGMVFLIDGEIVHRVAFSKEVSPFNFLKSVFGGTPCLWRRTQME